MTRNSKTRQPLLILTYPRTASNLFMRMLAMPTQQHTVAAESGGYFFMPAIRKMREMKLLDRPSTGWTEAEWAVLTEAYSSCTDRLQELLQAAQATGKMAVFKEHTPFIISPNIQASFVHRKDFPEKPWRVDLAQNHYAVSNVSPPLDLPYNEAVVPGDFLVNCVPAFLIRHPALAFPSYYRVMQSLQGTDGSMETMESALTEAFTLQWTRNLYDWFLAANKIPSTPMSGQQRKPIILDADDFLTDPDLVLHFCDLVGLDPSKVRFEWDPATNNQLETEDPTRLRTRSTLFASSGIVPGKTFQGLTIDGEMAKWRLEFGDYVATKLECWVRMAMPDYNYLAGKRLQVRRKNGV